MLLSFYLGRGTQDGFPKFTEECKHTNVNLVQIVPTSPIYELQDCFKQTYTTSVDIIVWESKIEVI